VLVDHPDGDSQLASGLPDYAPYVEVQAEPQLFPEGQAGSQGLSDEPTRPPVAGRDDGCLVQEGAEIENLEHLGVGVTNAIASRGAEPVQETGELALPGHVQRLEEPPVPTGR